MDIGRCANCDKHIVLGPLMCQECGNSFCSEECAGFYIGQEEQVCNKCKECNNRYYKDGKIAVLYAHYAQTFATKPFYSQEDKQNRLLQDNIKLITDKELVEIFVKYKAAEISPNNDPEIMAELSRLQDTWNEILQKKYGFDFKWVDEVSLSKMSIYMATPGKQFVIVADEYGEYVIEGGIIL